MFRTVLLVVIFTVLNQDVSGLQCWHCSSDLDPMCRDMFNASIILNQRRYGGGSIYDNQQNYQNQRYDNNQNYPSQRYDSNSQYNPNYPNNNRNYQGGSNYDSNRNYQDRNYQDRNYQGSNYQGSNYNQGSNYQGSNPSNYNNRQGNPQLLDCHDEDARHNRKKNVCIKKVTKSTNGYYSVIRRCEMVQFDQVAGTCYDPVSRGISLEFCEYCDYDGCNAASGLKTNIILASLIPLGVLLFFRQH